MSSVFLKKIEKTDIFRLDKEIPHPTKIGCGLYFGADDEARTRYLNLGKVALYQMSYIRISFDNVNYYTIKERICQVFFEKKFKKI